MAAKSTANKNKNRNQAVLPRKHVLFFYLLNKISSFVFYYSEKGNGAKVTISRPVPNQLAKMQF